MIQRIKTWVSNYKEKRRRKQILKDIKEAKRYFMKGRETCMCACFSRVDEDKYYRVTCIREIIPEYTPEILGATEPHNIFWWAPTDRESRIKAFDKLIEIYSK